MSPHSISLRSIAIMVGMCIFAGWATATVALWTWLIIMPLAGFAGLAAATMDWREGRRP